MEDRYGWSDPSVKTILGLAVRGDLLSKDSEDRLGGITGLKAVKERVRS